MGLKKKCAVVASHNSAKTHTTAHLAFSNSHSATPHTKSTLDGSTTPDTDTPSEVASGSAPNRENTTGHWGTLAQPAAGSVAPPPPYVAAPVRPCPIPPAITARQQPAPLPYPRPPRRVSALPAPGLPRSRAPAPRFAPSRHTQL